MKSILYNLFLLWCLFHFLFSFFFGVSQIDGTSMRPTLSDNEYVFYAHKYYKDNQIKLGDIILFEVKNEENLFIKRVVGIPGDIIEMKNGILSVNGIKKTDDVEIEMNIFEEKINKSNIFKILNISKSEEHNNFKKIKIPEDHYFVLGDNREVSHDSRDMGLIKKENIIHKYLPKTHYIYNLSKYFFALESIF